MSEIAKAYESGDICGWAEHRTPGLAKESFLLMSAAGLISPFTLQAASGKKTMLYLVARKILGHDITNYPQEIGDCTSFGGKNAAELLQCTQILLVGDHIKWRPVFPPYYYGCSRVYIGKNRIGPDDGSMGSWVTQAAMKYGTLFSDESGVPHYAGKVAKSWGDANPKNDLDKWVATGGHFLVKSTTIIRTWSQLVAAIANGYPVTTASNVGYEMLPRSDGFHHIGKEPWPHQMAFIGVCDNDKDPYAIIQNNWGDQMGHLKDFDDGHDLPISCLRVRRADAEKHLAAKDSWAWSHMDGFHEQHVAIDKALFKLL